MREENLYKTSVFSNKDTLSEPYLMSFITKALNRIFFGHSIISVMKKKMW